MYTATKKVLNWKYLQSIVDEQIGNLTQDRSKKGPYRDIRNTLLEYCKLIAHLTMINAGPTPAIGHKGWKGEMSDLSHSFVNKNNGLKRTTEITIKKLRKRFPKAILYFREGEESWVQYSLAKLAMVASSAAVMIVYKYDPDWLLMTHQESIEEMIKTAQRSVNDGKPTVLLNTKTGAVTSVPHLGSAEMN